ncbi:unnamed protein product [Polarella glacialis]|uniref:Uncharacterized protein n=1 Tax=Polarella glacialis TaxID=89957 RepID=A0A813D6Y6_POLGL|nr:unnamed protein product [Polarella glacialis]
MPTSFSHFLQQVPEELQDVLRENGIGGHCVDAKIFLRLLDAPTIVLDWKTRTMEPMSQKEKEKMIQSDSLNRALEKLRYGALATPCYESLTELQKWLMDNEFSPESKSAA